MSEKKLAIYIPESFNVDNPIMCTEGEANKYNFHGYLFKIEKDERKFVKDFLNNKVFEKDYKCVLIYQAFNLESKTQSNPIYKAERDFIYPGDRKFYLLKPIIAYRYEKDKKLNKDNLVLLSHREILLEPGDYLEILKEDDLVLKDFDKGISLGKIYGSEVNSFYVSFPDFKELQEARSGCTTGPSGTGKSVITKMLLAVIALQTPMGAIIIDPSQEYSKKDPIDLEKIIDLSSYLENKGFEEVEIEGKVLRKRYFIEDIDDLFFESLEPLVPLVLDFAKVRFVISAVKTEDVFFHLKENIYYYFCNIQPDEFEEGNFEEDKETDLDINELAFILGKLESKLDELINYQEKMKQIAEKLEKDKLSKTEKENFIANLILSLGEFLRNEVLTDKLKIFVKKKDGIYINQKILENLKQNPKYNDMFFEALSTILIFISLLSVFYAYGKAVDKIESNILERYSRQNGFRKIRKSLKNMLLKYYSPIKTDRDKETILVYKTSIKAIIERMQKGIWSVIRYGEGGNKESLTRYLALLDELMTQAYRIYIHQKESNGGILVMDEAHYFLNPSDKKYKNIVPETLGRLQRIARKYKIGLHYITQFLSDIPSEIRDNLHYKIVAAGIQKGEKDFDILKDDMPELLNIPKATLSKNAPRVFGFKGPLIISLNPLLCQVMNVKDFEEYILNLLGRKIKNFENILTLYENYKDRLLKEAKKFKQKEEERKKLLIESIDLPEDFDI